MHRIDADAHVSNQFSDGDPGIGQPGTRLDAAWANAVQEEIAAVIEDAGITLEKGTNNQLAAAIASRFPAVSWTAPSYAANWADQSGGATPVGYWKDSSGVVHLRGSAQAATGAGQTILTLPAGFRPAHVVYKAGVLNSVVVAVAVGTGGAVQLTNNVPANGDIFALDPVSFVAEQ